MKKVILLLLAMTVTTASIHADSGYGIYVGGVEVTQSNYNNITGNNIKPYLDSSGPCSVTYNPNTKILTLTNVSIERKGSDNRAIFNKSCEGLTIVFVKSNKMEAADSSPLRFNVNTTITSPSGHVSVYGGSENALTVAQSATLTINDASIYCEASNSSAIIGDTGNESIIVKDSHLRGTSDKSDYCALRNFKSLKVTDSRLDLKTQIASSAKAVDNLKAFSIGGNKMRVLLYSYDSTKKTFVNAGGYAMQQVLITSAASFDDRNDFPDANFAEAVRWKPYGMDDDYKGYYIQLPTKHHSGNANQFSTYLGLTGKNVTSVKGIEYLTDLTTLYADSTNITTMDLSNNTKLETIWCRQGKLSSLILPQTETLTKLYCNNNNLKTLSLTGCIKLSELECGHNPLTSLNVSPCKNWLTTLRCEHAKLTSLNVSECIRLAGLICNDNLLTTLTLPSTQTSSSLDSINCSNNKLTSLNIMPLYQLSSIKCANNSITNNFLLSEFRRLTTLLCQNNQIGKLTVTNSTELVDFDCSQNRLQQLNLKWNTKLAKNINCWGNNITGSNMTDLINSLPTSPYGRTLNLVNHTYATEGNEITANNVQTARSNGWTITHRLLKGNDFVATPGCEAFDLYVAGAKIYSCYNSKIAEQVDGVTGFIGYSGQYNILTMDNATVTFDSECIRSGRTLPGLNIVLRGENTLTVTQPSRTAVYFENCDGASVSSSGDGVLNINTNSNSMGFYFCSGNSTSDHRVTFQDCTINIAEGGCISGDQWDENLTIDNTNLHLSNGYISTGYDLQLVNCHISKPEGGYVDRGSVCTANSGTYFTGEIEILAGTPVNPGITGDVNGDGKVDVEDVNAVINIILELKSASDYSGEPDVTGDHKVDVEDVNAIINIILTN